MTPTQRDLFWDAQLHPQASTFNIGVSLLLPEPVEATRWSAAVQRVMAAQNIMRTVFAAPAGQPQQGPSPDVPAWFAHHLEPT